MNKPEKFEDMAYELFCLCLNMFVDDLDLFNFLCDRYPLLLDRFDKETKEDLEDVDLPEMTEEEKQASWERLCARIRAEYGEDAI